MGQYTAVASVPYKTTVWEGESGGMDWWENDTTGYEGLDKFLKDFWNDDMFCEDGAVHCPEHNPFEYKGWAIKSDDTNWGRDWPDNVETEFCFVKEGNKVYYLNEHQDENDGYELSTFISNEIESLEAFCKDWGFGTKIEKNAQARQTA